MTGLDLQVLADAAAIDAKYERGEDIGPLCGLGFVVKDNIDVAGILAGRMFRGPSLVGVSSPVSTTLLVSI